MKISALIFIAVTLSLPSRVQGQNDVCPFVIGVAPDGAIYDLNVPNMPALRRSPNALEHYLGVGCYNDANPSKVTSATLEVAPYAPSAKVDLVYAIFAKAGWSKDKVIKRIWVNAPIKPSGPSRD